MKDNKQNLTDLVGALAVDIEEIKKNWTQRIARTRTRH